MLLAGVGEVAELLNWGRFVIYLLFKPDRERARQRPAEWLEVERENNEVRGGEYTTDQRDT